MNWSLEIQKGERFKFGKNWKSFVKENLTDKSLNEAIRCTKKTLEKANINIQNKEIIDIGCGSGLFSLVILKLGAKHVTCVDYDPDSISCTTELLKSQNYKEDNFACIEGSILDESFVEKLGKYDLVYSWGVLHHTGDLLKAIKNSTLLIKEDGSIFISLYQKTILDRFWKIEKRFYSGTSKFFKLIINNIWVLKTRISFALKGRSFNQMISSYDQGRGMNFYKDVYDWLGGYPYEGITPKACISIFLKLGFTNTYLNRTGKYWALSSTCNEFVFRKENN